MTGLSLQNFSLGCILHVHTRKPLMCLLVNNYYKLENLQRRSFYYVQEKYFQQEVPL